MFVRRLPPKRGSRALAAYFDELYPGKVVGAVGARRTATLDSLIAARDAHRVRAARLRRRRQHKGRGLSCVDKAHARLEDAYDPLFWTRSLDAAARLRLHDERAAERDDRLSRERQRAAAQEPLVASGQAAAPVTSEKGGTPDVPQRLSSGAWEADDECAGGVFFLFSRGDGVRCTPSTRQEYPDGRADRRWEDVEAPWAAAWAALRGGHETEETTGLLSGRRTPGKTGPSFGAGFVGFRTLSGAAVATQVFHAEAPGGLVATPAPEPRDVIWRNIGFDTNTRAALLPIVWWCFCWFSTSCP